jgi:hypothetical protein
VKQEVFFVIVLNRCTTKLTFFRRKEL